MDIEIALDIINKQQDAWMNTSNDPVRFDIWDGLEAAKRRIQAAIIVAVLCHWGEATVQALTASPFAVGDRVKHRDGTIGTVIESRGGDAWIRVRWDNPDICMYWNPDTTSHYYDQPQPVNDYVVVKHGGVYHAVYASGNAQDGSLYGFETACGLTVLDNQENPDWQEVEGVEANCVNCLGEMNHA